MTKFIAILALVVISIGIMLGNYWWTFGLWPQSWRAFTLFAIANVVVSTALSAVLKSDE